ncbi:S-layer homology domain-containing protein [Paenibacillus polysaccharolyticus]|uniref:S-layer homology domain-containing protein n=1 Tax=Paenibacillus polysaccharolyticus TaxID=582692 RepID=UPI00209D600D|nr:S-layer homology domain-containing protein [Paenibacillus polysaccharolyticus]MCP1134164.1 S-layer homology domain-containing protein [Paenibacillus polysaccharolyticus]
MDKLRKPVAILLSAALMLSSGPLMYPNKVLADGALIPGLLIQDDFSDGDYTVSPEWHVSSGQWQVTSDPTDAANQVLFQNGTDEGFITTGEPIPDKTVSMRFYTGAGEGFPGILPRFQDKSNYYYFQMQVPGNKLVFSKRVNGADTTLKSVEYAFSKNTWYTLKVSVSGTSIRGYIVENGMDRLVFDLNDTSIATGTVGIRNKWQTVHIDDVMIAEPPRVNEAVLAKDGETASSISLHWPEIEGATGYRLYRSNTQEGGYSYVSQTSSTSYVDEGLSSDTAYYYRLAYDYGALTESQWSVPLEAKTAAEAPQAPGDLKATALTATSVKLSWNTVSKANGYRVVRAEQGTEDYEQVYDGNLLSFTDQALEPGKNYSYRVTAYNAAGESAFSTAEAQTYTVDSPSGFGVTAITDTSISLGWAALPGSEVSYTVSKATSASGTYQQVYTGKSTSLDDTGLMMGTGYFYTIQAKVDGMDTPVSAPLGVSTVRTSITPGQMWPDQNGKPIDAHGAGFFYDEKTEKYYWYGEYHTGGWPAAGVRAYSSKDLMNWTDEGMALTMLQSMDDFDTNPLIKELYAGREDRVDIWADIRKGRIIERPKVIYNDKTKKYVMWAHMDGDKDPYNNNANYGKAKAGYAISDSPAGPFIYQKSYRMDMAPEGEKDYFPSDRGMARDMTLFKDDDGTGYLIYSSEENLTLYISKLTEDYSDVTGWHKQGLKDDKGNPVRDSVYQAEYGVDYVRVFPGGQREAPAMFKYQGKYYIITSGATGWAPNENKVTVADHIFGPWSAMTNPFVRTLPSDPDPGKAFGTQATSVIPVDPEKGKFIYVGDMWNGGNFANDAAKYVFLPIEFGIGSDIAIKWYNSWTPDLLNSMGKVDIADKLPEAVKLGEVPVLPSTVKVRDGNNLVSTPAVWTINHRAMTAEDFAKPGPLTLQITTPEYNNKTQAVRVFVIPENTLYFVNSGGYDTADYKLMSSYMQDTLMHPGIIDQMYAPANGQSWGYVSADALPSGSNGGDIFSTVRYLNGGNVSNSPKGKDLTYSFDVPNGEYDVYAGFNDPWTNTSRRADLLINGTNTGAVTYIPASVRAQNGIQVSDGKLDITVRNTASQDPLISWIMIVKPDISSPGYGSGGLHSVSATPSSVTLGWDTLHGAATYKLYRSNQEEGTYEIVYSGALPEYTDSGLSEDTVYYYKVEALDDASQSIKGLSDPYQITTTRQTAADVASGITTLEQPTTASVKIKLPVLPQGFTASVHSSTAPSVVQLDGSIILPASETTVWIELAITRTSDGSKAITTPLIIKVPARTTSPGGNDSGGNSGGGSGNSSGGNNGNGSNPGNGGQIGNNNGTSGTGQSQSSTQPVTEKDRAVLELQASSAPEGNAQSKVDASAIEAAVKAAPLTDTGQRLVEFRLKSVPEAAAYELALPVSSLLEQKPSDVFRIVSAFATVELPADLLAKEGANEGTAIIRLIRTPLSQGITDRLGAGHGVQIEFSLNHQNFMPDREISIELPYTSSKDTVADKVIAVQIGASGEIKPLPQSYYDPQRGEIIFSANALSLTGAYAALSMEENFSDLAGVPWAQKAMEALAVRGVVDATGSEDTRQLHPKQDMTRGQYVQWLVASLGLNGSSTEPFKDVNEQSSYYKAVNIARSLGITDGAGDGRFKPESTITRQEMMTLTVRALVSAGLIDDEAQNSSATDLARFRDAVQINSYARESVAALVNLGIVGGYNGEVKPAAEASRAESATLIYAMMSKLVWKK